MLRVLHASFVASLAGLVGAVVLAFWLGKYPWVVPGTVDELDDGDGRRAPARE